MFRFNKFSPLLKFIIGIGLVFTAVVLDYITGPEITFSLFYLSITVYFSWFLGLWPGLAAAVGLGILSEVVDAYGGKHYSHFLILVWSAGMKSVILGFVAMLLNLLQNREKELRRSVVQLERANRELDSFTSMVSHDLQAPLHTLKATLYLLEKNIHPQEEKAAKLLQHMERSVERMTQLVKEVLACAKVVETEKSYEKIDLQSLIGELTHDLEALIKEKNATIEVSQLPVIAANRIQMRQLFQNLISNALKYGENQKPPVINISYQQKDRFFEVYVADNGRGINEEQQERIFLPFQRLHSDIEGTGIGLPICKKIVERHGGNICVESRVSRGSRFIVRLPAY